MTARATRHRVGELRPSQLLTTFGVGAVVDLPNVSAMVMGLEDWDTTQAAEVGEDRLRQAVQDALGAQVRRLLSPPLLPDSVRAADLSFGDAATVGVPVATYPRWMVCPYCRLLAPVESDLFQLKVDPYRAERTRYLHQNCPKPGAPPSVLPARFLVACVHGHLDDFPWVYFVHGGPTDCRARLRLREFGVSGEAADIEVVCEECDASRRMAAAFGAEAQVRLPLCRGRRPHLRDYDPEACDEQMRTILLGASNSWFAVTLSALSVPIAVDKLGQLVDGHWHVLEKVASAQNIELLRALGQLPQFAEFDDERVWAAVERRRAGMTAAEVPTADLRSPEWRVFTGSQNTVSTPDFLTRPVVAPTGYERLISRVVLVERLREVSALIGFTRIMAPGDFGEVDQIPERMTAPLARREPQWVPAAEVRGEGIFLQFDEAAVQTWACGDAVEKRGRILRDAHTRWRLQRHLAPPQVGFPGVRYVLLHSFAHALMRQLALECGYTAASLRERIYSLGPQEDEGPMAGVLIYTSAPDSEGTLGGLVRLGTPEQLARHLDAALEQMRWCASDPLCAEHSPAGDAHALHAAACHACLFAPETSCERGNKYLDRAVLVPTVTHETAAFFATE